MTQNVEKWHQELLQVDTGENHKETLAQIEFAILESPAADCCAFRLKAFWLLRHLAQLI